jgi:hypothetical protein
MRNALARGLIEVGFILLLFYANLLMGEYNRTGAGRSHGLVWALGDVFTCANFVIGLLAGLVGYAVVELLRKRLQ